MNMKTLLITLLLSSALFAERYKCKNTFLSVEPNAITITTEEGKTLHARRGYGAFCYDFLDKEKQVSICLQKNGDTFTWTTSEGEHTEKCVRIEQ